jgi:hypothetical protein
MASRDNLQIDGIQEALADLNKLDPSYRRQVTKDITAAGQKTVAEARSMVQSFRQQQRQRRPAIRHETRRPYLRSYLVV